MYPSTKKVPTEQEALLRLSSLCSRSEHSSGEMRDKLRRWGVDSETSERVVARLVSERFVDDERFCRFFVRDKIRFDRWGRRKIEQALYAKGVCQDISAAVPMSRMRGAEDVTRLTAVSTIHSVSGRGMRTPGATWKGWPQKKAVPVTYCNGSASRRRATDCCNRRVSASERCSVAPQRMSAKERLKRSSKSIRVIAFAS